MSISAAIEPGTVRVLRRYSDYAASVYVVEHDSAARYDDAALLAYCQGADGGYSFGGRVERWHAEGVRVVVYVD